MKVKFVEVIKNPSILSIVFQLNYVKDCYEFISDSKFFLFQLVFDNLTRKIKLIVNQNEEKNKEKKFLNKKRHNSKHMNKLVFFEDSFDEISQFLE
jgi:hypothetical protein